MKGFTSDILFFFLLSGYFISTNISTAQLVQQEWVRRFNGPESLDDSPQKIAVAPNGDIVVTGSVFSNSQRLNIATVQYNQSGAQVWSVIYNSPGNLDDYVTDMAINALGDVYLVGLVGINFGPFDWIVIKYNSNGVQQWVKMYDGSSNYSDIAVSVKLDQAGNIFVGSHRNTSGNTSYVTVAKYLPNSDTMWIRNYQLTNVDQYVYGGSIELRGNQLYVGASFTPLFPVGSPERFLTLRYDTSGTLMWARTFAISQVSLTGSWILLDNPGFIYRFGYSSGNLNNGDIIIVKYNSNGDTVWVRDYNSPFNGIDVPQDGAIDNSNNIYLCGYSTGNNSFDYITLKYNTNGNLIWQARYTGGGNFTNLGARALTIDNNSNVYVIGTFLQSSVNKIGTIKYDSSGILKWVTAYNGVGLSVAIDSLTKIYSIGTNSDSTSGFDWVTIKYSQLTGIEPIGNKISESFRLYQNYPNPFNSSTIIKFDIPKSALTVLRIYNILGSEVETLLNQKISAGSYRLKWNASGYGSGVYFYILETEGFRKTNKIILLK